MVRRWKKAGLVLLLGAALAAASGCQAVGGVDIGKALMQQVSITSAEANGSWSVQVIPGEGSFSSDEEKAVADILGSAKLDLTHVAMQDVTHISVDGKLSYASNAVPFRMELEGNRILLQIEGGKKPIVIGDSSAVGADSSLAVGMLTQQLTEQLQAQSAQIGKVITRFVFRNAPNPAHVDVSTVTDTVYGQTLSLHKVHAELSGSELNTLVLGFLKAAAADDQGLKDMLGELYDIFVPMIKKSIQDENDRMKAEYGDDIGSDESQELEMAYLDNKTLAVEFAYTTIKQYLDKAVKKLDNSDAAAADAGTAGGDADAQLLLSDRLSLKTDLYLDNDLYVRKEHIDLTVPIGDEKLEPVAAIRLIGDAELWNQNKPVAVSPIAAGDDALQMGGLDGADSTALLANFAPDSAMYRLLKDDLHITRQQTTLLFTANDEYEYDSTHPFIDENGVAMVPARFIAERFGADVTWDDEKQAVIIDDVRTGTNITLQIGSSTAEVNGKQVQMPSAATMKYESAFVPLRFIAEALGAKLEWDDSTQAATITRE